MSLAIPPDTFWESIPEPLYLDVTKPHPKRGYLRWPPGTRLVYELRKKVLDMVIADHRRRECRENLAQFEQQEEDETTGSSP